MNDKVLIVYDSLDVSTESLRDWNCWKNHFDFKHLHQLARVLNQTVRAMAPNCIPQQSLGPRLNPYADWCEPRRVGTLWQQSANNKRYKRSAPWCQLHLGASCSNPLLWTCLKLLTIGSPDLTISFSHLQLLQQLVCFQGWHTAGLASSRNPAMLHQNCSRPQQVIEKYTDTYWYSLLKSDK